LKSFFDPSPPLIAPQDLVLSFTRKKKEELMLPKRAVITIHANDVKALLRRSRYNLLQEWAPFKTIYQHAETVITKTYFGGPNIAALVEELSAFGVKECVLWGYCGGIDPTVRIGDILIIKKAFREEGISYHYMAEMSTYVSSNWFTPWLERTQPYGFRQGTIWTLDAIYRETESKVQRHKKRGISGVDMEVASFYAVCRYRNVRAIAFLVVSDVFYGTQWISGFHRSEFKSGVAKLTDFIVQEVIA